MTATFRPLTPADWPEIERLFGPRGACGGCWCMLWRIEKGGKTWDAMKGAPAKTEFARLIAEDRAHGVLCFEDGAAIGWCSIGPRDDFPRLLRSRVLQRERAGAVWAVTCFYLARDGRGRGLGTRLLEAAASLAFARGASEVEGYPATVKPGARLPASFAWTGTATMFERAGFSRVERPEGTRVIFVKRAA